MAQSAKSKSRPRVLIVDDHPIVREGLLDLINREAGLVCCGAVGSIPEAQTAVAAQQPDLVLLDLRLGNTDGLELIKCLRCQFADLKILVLSQLDETVYAERVLRAGASGYVMKEKATEEVLSAIQRVLQGQIYVSASIANLALQRLATDKPGGRRAELGCLTDRELHVFKLVGSGLRNKEIAAELRLSVKTIETYREHIKYKLGLASGAELAQQARNWAGAEAVAAARSRA